MPGVVSVIRLLRIGMWGDAQAGMAILPHTLLASTPTMAC